LFCRACSPRRSPWSEVKTTIVLSDRPCRRRTSANVTIPPPIGMLLLTTGVFCGYRPETKAEREGEQTGVVA